MENFKDLLPKDTINKVAFYVIGGLMAAAFIAGVLIALYHVCTLNFHTPSNL